MQHFQRGTMLLGLVALSGAAVAAEAIGAPIALDIRPQPIGDALNEFARQSGLQVVIDPKDGAAITSPRVRGTYEPKVALTKLLANTGLRHEYLNERTIAVRVAEADASESASHAQDAAKEGASPLNLARPPAQSDRPAQQSDGPATNDSTSTLALEEVIVSAQKRTTSLQDTALSLSVLSGEDLERRSLVSATDYLSTVPGVHIDSYGLGDNLLVIRGLGIEFDQTPTAGAYLGDVPLTDALDFAITDVKLVDMERVEVLRGPQGTLYGAGAMGGAIRQVPAAPVIDRLESYLKLGYATTARSNDPSYNAVGVVNLPLVDKTLALRATAYHFRKAGYVDLVETASARALSNLVQLPVVRENDVGGHEYTGFRASSLFTPTDELSVTLMLGYQKLHEDRRSEIVMSTKQYVASVLDTGREFREQEFRYANLSIDYDFSWAKLTSSTSWTRTDREQRFSHTRLLPSASHSVQMSDKDALFQEVRIATSLTGPIQFVGGGYYERIEVDSGSTLDWTSPNLTAMQAFWGRSDPHLSETLGDADLEQLALFGELSYRIADPLTLTAGARWFDYERHASATTLLGVAPGVAPVRTDTGDLRTEEDGQVYKLGLDYKPNDDTLIYATWSQGFRLGQTVSGDGGAFAGVCDADDDGYIDGSNYRFQSEYTLLSDRLNSMEVGGKLTLLDGRLNVNTAVYRIDWHDIPTSVNIDVGGLGCGATFNGGKARSQGVELETVFRATEHLRLNVSGSLMDTEHRDNLTGQKGQRLPFSPKYNASVALQYDFDAFARPAFLRSDLSYVGRSANNLNPPNVKFTDAYHTLGLRAGIAFDKFTVELYGTNLTNEDALIGVFNLDRGWRMAPRAFGMDVNLEF